jgi:hypothetical protein
VKQATAVGGDMLLVTGREAEKVAKRVVASAKPPRWTEALQAAHAVDVALHAAMFCSSPLFL